MAGQHAGNRRPGRVTNPPTGEPAGRRRRDTWVQVAVVVVVIWALLFVLRFVAVLIW